MRTRAPWRDLPECYGSYATVYNHSDSWRERGIWRVIFEVLVIECEDAQIFVDNSFVKAHRATEGANGGNWPKSKARKPIRYDLDI